MDDAMDEWHNSQGSVQAGGEVIFWSSATIVHYLGVDMFVSCCILSCVHFLLCCIVVSPFPSMVALSLLRVGPLFLLTLPLFPLVASLDIPNTSSRNPKTLMDGNPLSFPSVYHFHILRLSLCVIIAFPSQFMYLYNSDGLRVSGRSLLFA
ncbi:hypothetical protein BGX38DRAFT_225995 [Terfezia claveryi]|nr:hypothetical protein BGX38DRAFT_225995 [Terfezia claveryi]